MTAAPRFIPPQLARLVENPPAGDSWLHEIKLDGYRMHARIEDDRVRLLTRTGLDWTDRYPEIAKALAALPVTEAYLDGELCAISPDGITSFALLQAAAHGDAHLIYFAFDLLHLDGAALMATPLIERKDRLAELLEGTVGLDRVLRYVDHRQGHGAMVYKACCDAGLEGIVSKPARGLYLPGDRRQWLKVKCLNREEFVVVGWSAPEGSRHRFGSLLLGYYTEVGELIYAGRVGTGFTEDELEYVWRKLQPLATAYMPLTKPPPRDTRFGRPLALSRVRWVRPELVAEVDYLTWTEDGLLRHVTYQGLREDKPARDVRRERPGGTTVH